jgi:hypothetical protein
VNRPDPSPRHPTRTPGAGPDDRQQVDVPSGRRSGVTSGEQLVNELAKRLAPVDELARAAGAGPPLPSEVLAHVAVGDLATNLDTGTARAIIAALWPTGVAPTWWRTPLGRAVAGQLADATPTTQVVKVATAARMLGMSHSRVIQLVGDGLLTRTDAGIELASVYHRIAHPGRPGRPGWRPAEQR